MSPRQAVDESWMARWRRRAISIPVVLLLCGLLTMLLPAAAAVCAALDLVRRQRLAWTRTACFLALFLWCEVAGVAWSFLLWLALCLGRDHDAFVRRNALLQTRWCTALYELGAWLYGVRMVINGDAALPLRGPLLVMVRHASTVDTVLPVLLLSRTGGLFLRYVLKRELLPDPCLDIVGNRLPNRFVRRGSGNSQGEIARVAELIDDLSESEAVVIFPEGTRFTPAKRQRLLSRLARSAGPDRPSSSPLSPDAALSLAQALSHTLSPLQLGPLALLRRNRGADLLIVGHTGLEAAGSLATLSAIIGQTIFVHLHRVPFASIPTDPEAQADFLGREWLNMDRWIAATRTP